jgi:hypothetical protein
VDGRDKPDQDAAHAGYNWRMSVKCAIAELGELKIGAECRNSCPWTMVNAI